MLNILYIAETYRIPTSSKRTNSGALSIVLAIATLCFSPPLSFNPLSPTFVLYPEYKIKGWIELENLLNVDSVMHFQFPLCIYLKRLCNETIANSELEVYWYVIEHNFICLRFISILYYLLERWVFFGVYQQL